MAAFQEICTELLAFIRSEFVTDPAGPLSVDTPLLSGGVIDSFSFVALQRFIQKRFGVSVPDACINADQFDTVTQMATVITTLAAEA